MALCLVRGCLGKHAYTSREEARKQAKVAGRRAGVRCRPYFCPFGAVHWHITSSTPRRSGR